ncbi:LysR family transcriptional regulator [Methyloglobulus sp.]|uniref:LysR family transcriptional regulator n=1 Tax=Methyloglobulus sp. TaxID=2518622 RepID=UPI0032B735AA
MTRAAEQMFVTQSAMSHILHRLRQQLDDALLVKTPTGMKPTERALALIEPVRALLTEMEQLFSRLWNLKPAPASGVLSLPPPIT